MGGLNCPHRLHCSSFSAGLNRDTPSFSTVQLDPCPQTTDSAAFLKGDKKRGGDSGDDPWEDVPRAMGWLVG